MFVGKCAIVNRKEAIHNEFLEVIISVSRNHLPRLVKKTWIIMLCDSCINGDAQRIGQITWMFYLKVSVACFHPAKKDLMVPIRSWKRRAHIGSSIGHLMKRANLMRFCVRIIRVAICVPSTAQMPNLRNNWHWFTMTTVPLGGSIVSGACSW